MEDHKIVEQARRISKNVRSDNSVYGAMAEAKELLRIYGGEKTAFFKTLNDIKTFAYSPDTVGKLVIATLDSFIKHIENGLLEGISIERKAQIDVVSDFLDQANTLLESTGVHPAAPTVIIGAALEEFLRNWVEESDLPLQGKKPSIDTYVKTLREAEKITKQDSKDITSWAGLRNHAAHGEWDQVSDKNRVQLMLEGVNLFMRKYGQY